MPHTILTYQPVARYFLRDGQITALARATISWWLQARAGFGMEAKRDYSDYIKEDITVNAVPLEQVWQAIRESDHIWFFSHFEEEGAAMSCRLLEMARENNLRDRIFFNMAGKSLALSNLHYHYPQARTLMKRLEADNNLRFFYFEDICKAAGNRMQAFCLSGGAKVTG